ncbi:MAG: NAD-dependent epimerase/dehydratase family protein [Flavobacteriales bacterium]|nr:NAD-dependent epimerase/dehydratase family protein [Flavobacteriales bacterium]
MNVLITGGAGFIGSSMAVELISRGHSVRILDNLSPQIHGTDPNFSPTLLRVKGKVDLHVGDVTNLDDWKKALQGIDCVVHLAAETGTGQSMYEAHHYMNVNVCGTAHLLDLLSHEGSNVKRIVVASSRAIYGEGKYVDGHGTVHYPVARHETDLKSGVFNPTYNGEELESVPTTEDTPFSPTSIYGISKQVQEQMILVAARTKGISAFALRYQNVYGPGQSLKNPYTGIISIFSKLLLANQPINIFEDGLESRDFVFIDDVVNATCAAIEHPDASAIESINIGNGIATSVARVADILKDLYRSDSALTTTGNYRLGDIRHNTADLTKAKQILGYASKTTVETGLKRFSEWVNTQKVNTDDSYQNSLDELKEKGLLK